AAPAAPPPKPPAPAPAAPAEPPSAPSKPVAAEETIRVEISKVDLLLDMVGELLISKIKMEDKLARSKELIDFCESLGLEEGRRLRDRISKFAEDLTVDMVEMNYLTQEIQNRAMKIRMLPAETIFDTFQRTVRDLSRELNKEVTLKLSGRKTELDKRVLEEIKPSLIHIIRNSMDHGIERPEVREARGKPRMGTIHLSAGHKGDTVTIQVEDDGGGIDPERVKKKALERGLIDAKRAQSMSDNEALYLIMVPGFSTAEIITDISGRGVGMDVVKTNVQNLKGDVTLASEVGKFTRIAITLPMTLSTMNVLLAESAGEIFAFPLNFLEETCIVNEKDLITEGGRSVLTLRGRTIAVCRLDTLLELPRRTPPSPELQIVLVHSRSQVMGFVVDRFLGNQEIVVKTLGDHLRHIENVAGATILGSGEPALILNCADLVSLASSERDTGAASKAEGSEHSRSILVVDDSITTRTMEKNVLETAGYEVDVAVNGHDALDKLAARLYNLVVSDIEMPGLNGFELITRMKKEDRLREIPVIIVSALATDEDKRRGIAVGANAYITKGTFDQENLLGTVRRLIR
ncbi:MAG: hybrid sensor histidine kinase/response regulator, partial [Candidatus Wallbacteria bacterium]|nr:hybrid sensor histidine kinase/response regulator [Candidatus Wallbacteria bacterium]